MHCISDCISFCFLSKFPIKSVFSAFFALSLASFRTTPSILSFFPFSGRAIKNFFITDRGRERDPRVRRANESCQQRSLIRLFLAPLQVLRNNTGTAIWPKKQSLFIPFSNAFGFTFGFTIWGNCTVPFSCPHWRAGGQTCDVCRFGQPWSADRPTARLAAKKGQRTMVAFFAESTSRDATGVAWLKWGSLN